MVAYKEWGYQLYPGVAFEDLASRTEKLGGRERTRDLMLDLRNTERDRVIEAKYGSSAVDDAHAKDAAKAAAKEAAAAEKREKEELAKSRYMDVDEERAPPASRAEGAEGGEGGGGEGQTTGGASSGGGDGGGGGGGGGGGVGVVSEDVRERMEVNRRRAMERLRLKKEEAAAAAAAAAAVTAAATVEVGAHDENDDDPQMDMMDEETGWVGGDDFEDDEAALAEMQEEEKVVKKATSDPIITPSSSAAAAPTSADVDSAAEREAVQQSGESANRVVDTLLEPTEPAGETMEEAEARDSLFSADGSPPSLALDGRDGGAAGGTPLSVADAEAASDAKQADGTDGTETMLDAGGGSTNSDVASEKIPPDSGASPARLTERGECSAGDDQVGLTPPASGAEMQADGAVVAGTAQANAWTTATVTVTRGGKRKGAVDSHVQDTGFSSPGKKLKAAGGVPMSPLGSLFAGTDVPAEGGTAVVVKESLAGLFSDEDFVEGSL